MRYHLDVLSSNTSFHHQKPPFFHQSLSLGAELMHDIEFLKSVPLKGVCLLSVYRIIQGKGCLSGTGWLQLGDVVLNGYEVGQNLSII